MRHVLAVVVGAVVLQATAASAQVRRYPRDVFDDIILLGDVIRAFLDGTEVDDPEVLAREFPGRELADFDRNRDGEFMTAGDGFGVNDVDLAIQQFIHDAVDADDDGLVGFYELECEFAGGPRLDPRRPSSRDGVDDATQDCDGDGAANDVELRLRTNPLDPASVCIPADEVCDNADNDCDGLTDEGEAGTPGACDRRAEFFLREHLQIDPIFGFPLTLTEVVGWVRSYREPPADRPTLDEVEGCRLFDANAGGDAGAFQSVEVGPVSVRGGSENFQMTYDRISRNYGNPAPPLDLWSPGQQLELSAPGDDVGGFSITVPAPADLQLEAPTPAAGLSRANPVVQWTAGGAPDGTVRLQLNFSHDGNAWEMHCELPDVGEAVLPEAAMAWIPAETATAAATITRRITRTAVTPHPSATVNVYLDARFGGERVPLLP